MREFTDGGGTILLEASCGNPQVRKWAKKFVQELWPEWSLKPLGPEHGSFKDPNPLRKRPEILGLHDGMRTFLFYSMDDISCPWQTKAYAGRDYLFKWGINLFTYATDHSPLRAKLQKRPEVTAERYKSEIRAGAKANLRLARVKYDGPGWLTGRNYGCLGRLTKVLSKKASVNLTAEEGGVAPADLGDYDIAYLVGTEEHPFEMDEAQQKALKAYTDKGGFLWVEAAGGSINFNAAFRKLAASLGWELRLVPQTHPVMTGRFSSGVGYSLIANVQFRRAIRVQRLGRPHADLTGIYVGEKLVGLYSPLDILFSQTGYDAYGCRGYAPEDAQAVATNIVLFATDRQGAE